MQALKKWLFIFAAVVFVGSIFADKILSFYVDWLWFESHGIACTLDRFGFAIWFGVPRWDFIFLGNLWFSDPNL